ncbi:resolvase [Mycolicibacterium mageritense DSM 44476 = CIP 104973]|uniref:DNA invertase n=1 Tax=Mycolicibacterium mageritense TaxID=53462 RepID=A0ABM7I562_MYCME|nr:recombinase family protein [Mycolicibacterium mageritense]MCC9184132.1 recombinase family protein [Mycolicibacterium mageritense]BBX38046.1 DNA invertase [Mycolicibacterium mageritense]CDO27218.1 site-specific recombinase PinR [Mycolicibacterium mageritense DSM 44476 = CIP 104973]
MDQNPTESAAGRRLGYARISTDEQDEALQIRALEAAGIDALYIDHGVSGAKTSRPRLDAMLADLRRGDTVVVYSLSRLSRGTTHLMELSERFEHDGITLVSRTEQIDTSTAMGRFFYTVLAAQAAMERELLIERTRAGLEAARAAGRYGGRPAKLTADQKRHAVLLRNGGIAVDEIAKSLGASRATVYRALAEGKRSSARRARRRTPSR